MSLARCLLTTHNPMQRHLKGVFFNLAMTLTTSLKVCLHDTCRKKVFLCVVLSLLPEQLAYVVVCGSEICNTME